MKECAYNSVKLAYDQATKHFAKEPVGKNLNSVQFIDKNTNQTLVSFTSDKEQVQKHTNLVVLSEIYRKHFLSVESTKRKDVKVNYIVKIGEIEKNGGQSTEKENIKITNLQDLSAYLTKIGLKFPDMEKKAKELDPNNQMSI